MRTSASGESALLLLDLSLLRKLAAGYGAQTVRSLENVLGHTREKDTIQRGHSQA